MPVADESNNRDSTAYTIDFLIYSYIKELNFFLINAKMKFNDAVKQYSSFALLLIHNYIILGGFL